eukprot:4191002-Amphidinium_carterae.1
MQLAIIRSPRRRIGDAKASAWSRSLLAHHVHQCHQSKTPHYAAMDHEFRSDLAIGAQAYDQVDRQDTL